MESPFICEETNHPCNAIVIVENDEVEVEPLYRAKAKCTACSNVFWLYPHVDIGGADMTKVDDAYLAAF